MIIIERLNKADKANKVSRDSVDIATGYLIEEKANQIIDSLVEQFKLKQEDISPEDDERLTVILSELQEVMVRFVLRNI